jgi:hypothetical protein
VTPRNNTPLPLEYTDAPTAPANSHHEAIGDGAANTDNVAGILVADLKPGKLKLCA